MSLDCYQKQSYLFLLDGGWSTILFKNTGQP